jgi:YidC/Oxa1 family membrane protein insertase
MQNKNWPLFMLVSALIILGWIQLQNLIWPPPPRLVPMHVPDPRLWSSVPGSVHGFWEQAGGLAGPGGAGALATQVAVADWAAGEWQGPAAPEPAPVEEAPPPPIAQNVQHQEPTLGSDAEDSAFNLKVVLTTQGGGVQELVLNKFAQANRLGLPDGTPPERLGLIPDNPDAPSNLLTHYLSPVEGEPKNPVDTLAKQEWVLVEVKNGPNDSVHEAVFRTEVPGLDVIITKIYTLAQGAYHIGLELKFERRQGQPIQFRYQLAGAHGLPIEGEWYTSTFRNSLIGLVDSKGYVWRDLQDSRAIGFQEGGRKVPRDEDKSLLYAGVATQFFASVIAVDEVQEPGTKPGFLAWARPTVESEPNPKKPYLDDITVRVVSEPFELKPGVPVTHRYVLYNGPVKVRLLAQLNAADVDRYEYTLHLNTLTDYHSPTWFGRFASGIGLTNVIIACTNLMHGALWLLHTYVMPWSYGVCIILLTVLVRGAMFPISRRQTLASQKMQEKMQKMAPELKKIKEKYKDDFAGLQQAQQELYRKHGMPNPLGSCWTVFLQMPIFLGLYYALQESIFFRLAPFGWIKNLAAPDMLIGWGENIPLISRPEDQGSLLYLGPFFNLLPIIAVVFMILQQKFTMPPPTDENQAMQQKMMKYMMVFFGLMFYKVAAGLCLYFIASSMWGLAERKLLPKRQAAGDLADQKGAASGSPRSGPAATGARSKPRSAKPNGETTVQKMKDLWEKLLKEAGKK